MKKLFALLLVLMLALSLAACGENEDGGASGTNDAQDGQSTSGGNSTAPQGGNDTNKSGVWSDSDKQTVTMENQAGTYEITTWDAKEIDADKVVHPASSKHTVNASTATSVSMDYAPFKIVYINTYTRWLDREALGMALHEIVSVGDLTIFAMFEDGDTYQKAWRDTDRQSNPINLGRIEPGETVTVIGYIEMNPFSDKLFNIGSFVSVSYEGGSVRPKIEKS